MTSTGKLMIVDDFNFHWELENNRDSKSLRTILEFLV